MLYGALKGLLEISFFRCSAAMKPPMLLQAALSQTATPALIRVDQRARLRASCAPTRRLVLLSAGRAAKQTPLMPLTTQAAPGLVNYERRGVPFTELS